MEFIRAGEGSEVHMQAQHGCLRPACDQGPDVSAASCAFIVVPVGACALRTSPRLNRCSPRTAAATVAKTESLFTVGQPPPRLAVGQVEIVMQLAEETSNHRGVMCERVLHCLKDIAALIGDGYAAVMFEVVSHFLSQ